MFSPFVFKKGQPDMSPKNQDGNLDCMIEFVMHTKRVDPCSHSLDLHLHFYCSIIDINKTLQRKSRATPHISGSVLSPLLVCSLKLRGTEL